MSTQHPAGPSRVTDWSSGRSPPSLSPLLPFPFPLVLASVALAFVNLPWLALPLTKERLRRPGLRFRELPCVKPTLSACRDRPRLAVISDSPRRSDCLVPYQDDEEQIWRCCSSNRRGVPHPARRTLPALPPIRWQSSIASSHNHCLAHEAPPERANWNTLRSNITGIQAA